MEYLRWLVCKVLLFVLLFNGYLSSAQSYSDITDQAIKYRDFIRILGSLYIDTVNVKQFTEDAIVHVLNKLDPHSAYISAENAKKTTEEITGNFEGIGVEFNMLRDTLFVISTIVGGPSQKVGVLANDRIISVDGDVIAGVKMETNLIMKKLRGAKGTKVKITVLRRGVNTPIEFIITRDKIPIYSIDASFMPSPKVGYVKINRFSATTYDEFMEAIQKFKKIPETIILDLRGNSGGILQMSTAIADEFLGQGKIITYTEGRVIPRNDIVATEVYNKLEKSRVIVLIDETSASASEIVAGAIQDWDRGIILGRRSYGKGLVQEQIPLTDGSLLRITIARYHTPTGRVIQSPYQEGKINEYYQDFYKRYAQGEYYHKDSIKFKDTLRYKTLVSGRTVYGGGGIMPDDFIPIDTSTYSPYFGNLIRKGTLFQYIISYMEQNRSTLKKQYPTLQKFAEKFEITPNILDQLVVYATKDSIAPNPTEFSRSLPDIKSRLKAGFAQDLFGNTAYYQIILPVLDKVYQRALEYAENPTKYEALLQQ